MKLVNILQILLLLFSQFSFSQIPVPPEKKITGVWKGEFYVDSTKKAFPFEMTISEYDGRYSGYSRIEFEEKGIHQVVFRDHKILINEDNIIIEDINQLTKASSISLPKEVKKTMVFNLTSGDSTLHLNGTWTTNKTRRYLVATGSVKLEKKTDFKSTAIYKKLDELNLVNNLSFSSVPKEETELSLNRIILTDLTQVLLNKKLTRPGGKVVKPSLLLKPEEFPLVRTVQPPADAGKIKPATAVIMKKTAIAPLAQQPALSQPKEWAIQKSKKPVTRPSVTKENVPAPATAKIARIETSEPVSTDAARDVAKRTIRNEQSLYFAADSLQLTLYDNGEIDGDTVSVLLDGKIIIAKQGLTTKQNSHTIYFDRDSPDSQMLVMYAENLGTIPPNTGLLVVHEGKSVYEVRFSADLKTNAGIILRRKKEN